MKPTDPGYAEALDEMEAAEAAERSEGKPCDPCPWVSTDQRDKDAVADPIVQTQMKMGGWFCCHVNMGTCYGARLMHEKHVIDTAVEEFIDGMCREMYQQRSQSAQEMTDERWERIKVKFPGSVRSCREDVMRFHSDDVRAYRAHLKLNQETA